METQAIYELVERGYTFKVIPEERKQVKLLVIPPSKEDFPGSLIYKVICKVFEELSEEECQMIRYNFHYFKRGIGEIEFCNEFYKSTVFKSPNKKCRNF